MAVDPNIKKKADDIRNKIYGKEVRESLASGLEEMSSDVVETVGRQDEVESQFQDVIDNTTGKDVISAPEIIAARDGEANLKARLDKEHQEVTAQLAQTEQKTIPAIRSKNNRFSLDSRKIVSRPEIETNSVTGFSFNHQMAHSVNISKEIDGVINIRTNTSMVGGINSHYLEVSFRTPNIEDLVNLELRLYIDDDNYFNRALDGFIPKRTKPNELVSIRIPIDTLSGENSNVPLELNNDSYFILRVTAPRTFVMQYYGVYALDIKTPVILQFDDGHISVYEKAFPLMKERGIVGTFNVVTSFVGTPGYCTVEQLKEMQNAGWTIGNHSLAHRDLQTIPLEEMVDDIETSQSFLSKNGFTGSKVFAAPYNSFSYEQERHVKHVALSRKFGGRFIDPIYLTDSTVFVRSHSVQKNDSPSALLNVYNEAHSKGYYFSACFHVFENLEEPSDDYAYNIGKFEQFLDGLVNRNAYTVNMEDYIESVSIGQTDKQYNLPSEISKNVNMLPLNAFTSSEDISKYPKGISVFPVDRSGSNGFPSDYAGTVETHKINGNGWDRQIFHRYNSHMKWERYVNLDGSWSKFLRTANDSGLTSQRPTDVYIGYCFYDLTINKPIWMSTSNGIWRDADGNIV